MVFAEVCWPGCAPGGAVTFFCFAKRKSPKKRRPTVCGPCATLRGKPASGRLRGAPWNSLRCCAASFGQPRRVSGRSMRAATRMPTPQAPRRRRSQKGFEGRNPHGPSLRSAWCARRAAPANLGAERSDGPLGWHPPFRMRRGAQRPADQGSRLSERRRREFERDPAGREHRRLPAAKRRDAACRVALSLLTFFRRSERK